MTTPASTHARRIVLVKHATPLLVPEVTAEHWQLTSEGRAQCVPLADRLRNYALTQIITSSEPKAIETGQLIGRRLALPVATEIGLHEHDRSNVRLIPRPEFEARMAEFFAHPDDLIYGRETAHEALARFRAALERTLREYPDEALAIVTHGTVMALLAAQANDLEPYSLWLRLATPSFLVLTFPAWRIVEEVPSIS